MSDFEDELNGYLQSIAKVKSTAAVSSFQDQDQEQRHHHEMHSEQAQYVHPPGFVSSLDAPSFSQHPETQMWYDASTGTFSFYDAESGTYIPVQQDSHSASSLASGSVDAVTGYVVDSYQKQGQVYQKHVQEAPPDSDATIRLRIVSSNILLVGGVILMDASGLSFGRDRPLSGQGKRVRLVEMDTSRYHASIFIDRQEQQQVEQSITASMDPIPTPVAATDHQSSVQEFSGAKHLKDSTPPTVLSESKDSGEQSLPVNLNNENQKNKSAENKEAEDGETEDGEVEDGEIDDSIATDNDLKGEAEKRSSQELVEAEQSEAHARYWTQYQQYYEQQQYQQPPFMLDTFQIVDRGSTHGTFLNGSRLSEPRTASKPFELKHLDQLQIGTTVFEIHAHADGRVCQDCQVSSSNEIEVLDDRERESTPTTGIATDESKSINGILNVDREKQRLQEMKRLKSKYAVPLPERNSWSKKNDSKRVQKGRGDSPSSALTLSPSQQSQKSRGYVDRAAKRRQLHPGASSPQSMISESPFRSDHPVSGFNIQLAPENKGHVMLSKMGWKAGTGLGKSTQGVAEPVQLAVSSSKAGLGSAPLPMQGTAQARQNETQGEAARRRARERFAQLSKQ